MMHKRHSTGPGSVLRRRRPGQASAERRSGQTIVEFALVVPLFVVLLIGIIEFGFALNAVLAVNFATREAALVAAEAGNGDGADCIILQKIEDSITPPAEDAKITSIPSSRPTASATMLATATPTSGPARRRCTFSGSVTVTVPYSISGGQTTRTSSAATSSPAARQRPAGHDRGRPDRRRGRPTSTTGGRRCRLLNLGGTGYTIVKANSMRMEPVL